MYKIDLDVYSSKPVKWGEFGVKKTYKVSSEETPANGYIIQEVKKDTTAISEGKVVNTNYGISDLTSGNVMFAKGTYYEVFPIVKGTTCYNEVCIDDEFQNGAILRYTYEDKEWGADDEPPTTGTIVMEGRNVFVPTSEEHAIALHTKIQEDKGGSIDLGGVRWNLSSRTPANGLPFARATSFPLFDSFIKGKPVVLHKVTVTWDSRGVTRVQSTVTPLVGGRKKHRKTIRARAASKSYRKRRIGKATRRSRDRV
jgi:hypothetical protein